MSITACGSLEVKTAIRIGQHQAFPAGTGFAIAEQAYPSHRHQRISTIERNEIIETIKLLLEQRQLRYDPDSPYVINFYREFYAMEKDGAIEVKVEALCKQGRIRYQYSLNEDALTNDRDGALVADIIDRRDATLLRQVVSQYYFGKLQQAYRQDPDIEGEKYYRGIVALEHLFGYEVSGN